MKFQKIVGAGWNLALAQPFGLNWMCYLAGKCQMALMIFSLFPSWDKTIQILSKSHWNRTRSSHLLFWIQLVCAMTKFFIHFLGRT